MSTLTTRNDLIKPSYADAADIADINTNMDTIDASFALCNWAGTAAPTVNDDSGDGYSVGSMWFDTTNHDLYIAETVGSGTATWRALYPQGSSAYTSTSDPTVNDDSGDGFVIGSLWINTTGHKVFIAEDVTVGAAVWVQIPTTGTAWDIGAVEIRALTFQSDEPTAAPFTVASGTKVTNLNADKLDGLDDTAFVKQTLADAKGDVIVASAADTWTKLAVGTDGESLTANSTATEGVSWVKITDGSSRNLLINGEFLVNQTGISQYQSTTNPVNNDNTYLFDQWKLLSDGNDVMDVWQSVAQKPIGYRASILLQTETANKKAGIVQFIEAANCRQAIGNVVSLRFQALTMAAYPNSNIMAAVISWSGTSDAPTGDIVSAWEATNTAPTLVANWTYENVPARIALVNDTWTEYKIENISIDTANTTNIGVFLWLDDTDSAVDDRVYFTGVQLNIGAKCLPWASRELGAELNACQRYFYCINSAGGAYPHLGNGSANTTSVVYVEYHHPTEWFKQAATMTLIGTNWVIAGNAATSWANEGDKKQITYRVTGTGTPFTQYMSYLVYANNDATARVYMASRI